MDSKSDYLAGKTILITGSSRGIGKATAILAKNYGAEVILHGKNESKKLTNLAKDLDSKHIYCDVTNATDVRLAVGGLERIDVLVNSAGLQISKPFEELTSQDYLAVYNVNVVGPANISREVLPKMKEQGGGEYN